VFQRGLRIDKKRMKAVVWKEYGKNASAQSGGKMICSAAQQRRELGKGKNGKLSN